VDFWVQNAYELEWRCSKVSCMDIGRLHGCRDGRCKGNTSTLNRSGFITPIVQPSLWPRHPKVGASSGPRLVWNYVQAACDVTLPLPLPLLLLPLGHCWD